jgi:hypothetical protein
MGPIERTVSSPYIEQSIALVAKRNLLKRVATEKLKMLEINQRRKKLM